MALMRSWWLWKHVRMLLVFLCGIAIILFGIYLGYQVDWTGFRAVKTTIPSSSEPAKTLWDWLQLFIIPIIIPISALLFNVVSSRTAQKIALDSQREDLLETYLDRMSDLLLEKNLQNPSSNEKVCDVARVRTLTVLSLLDSRRKNAVLSFLHETGLLFDETSQKSIITFRKAVMRQADLRNLDFNHIDFCYADLSRANLTNAHLRGVDLSFANLSGTNLSGTDLSEAHLSGTDLSGADLRGADFRGADLTGKINLRGADLRGADFSRAILRGGVDLGGATPNVADLNSPIRREDYLKGIDLRGAKLRGTKFFVTDVDRLTLTEDQRRCIIKIEP